MNRRRPAGIAAWAALRYASDSLRHRREGARGYTIGDPPDVAGEGFLRAAESLTQAPISRGNEIECSDLGLRQPLLPAQRRGQVTLDAWPRRPVTERAREVGSRPLPREL